MRKNIQPADSIPTDAYNTYYMRTAERYRILKWILLLIFTLYLVFTLTVYRASITHENLMYLLRDFDVSASASEGFSSVVYEERQNRTFSVFRGSLVTAAASEISFFSPAGARMLHETTACASPVLDTGDKYLLLYDEGGTAYSVYTTIASVISGNTDSTIQCADMSASGRYAIATRSQDSKYIVILYSDSFREIARYYRDTYVVDVALSDDGGQLAILSISSDHSALNGVLTLCKAGTEETADILLGEHLPLRASYLANGTLAVVSDGGVHFFGADGGKTSEFLYQNLTLSALNISENRVAVVCREDSLGASSRIYVLSGDGSVVSQTSTTEKITAVYASDADVDAYLCTQNAVWSLKGATMTDFASYTGNLLSVCDIGETPVFCFASGAQSAANLDTP